MAKIKVLVETYVREEGEEFASSTTSLIQDNNLNVIADLGMDRKALPNSLAKVV